MRTLSVILLLFLLARPAAAVTAVPDEAGRWRAHVEAVSIVRDRWGIAHVYGRSDADAVFGMIYAQAEDDFPRIERNYLNGLGWLAQAEGEGALISDLRQRLFVTPAALQQSYHRSPLWLQDLMQAWADGLNYWLDRHPAARPKVIRHFEPWMALSFTEGSIGGDIESIDLDQLQGFYASAPALPSAKPSGTTGSNGIAIAPALSASGHALLWINPHTSFYFRSELQMVSEQGLNVYGAATWGQFFIYQGFNQHNGWMHPSYGGDSIDEYAETVVKRRDGLFYRYGGGWRRLKAETISIPYRDGDHLASRLFTVYHSHHGPIIRAEKDRWIAIRLLQDPVRTLQQSYLRTRTRDYAEFYRVQALCGDSSNNTVYADADGNIAYFHGNFVPRRNPKFDFTHPVDGSNPATEWMGPHPLEETIILRNPPNGWLVNTNNTPFTAAGSYSPKPGDYPAYMVSSAENARGLHAAQLLEGISGVTLDSLIATAYDSRLPAFDLLLPPLFQAFDQLPASDPQRSRLAAPIELLRGWDRRTATGSVATAVAIFWGQALIDGKGAAAQNSDEPLFEFLTDSADAERLAALDAAVARLTADFGNWRTPWGEINRFQRLSDDVVPAFDDARPSLPVALASARWGALASFDWTAPRRTRRLYGAFGNSFVAAVEFGERVRAKAILAGGESGDPASAHFADQIGDYAKGIFRDVLFYPEDVAAHAERRYHPGE